MVMSGYEHGVDCKSMNCMKKSMKVALWRGSISYIISMAQVNSCQHEYII